MIDALKRILPLLIAALVGFSYGRWGVEPEVVEVSASQTSADAEVVDIVHVPRAGVTYDLAVLRLHELAAFPKCFRQRLETERGEELLTGPDHLDRIRFL